ncbi:MULTISPECIES: hypothetical protein [unclassified Mesorhizobium]|uniref:hypothetical protein n=1 Tax=unclassified Mesorhizobium TaxID=325217 RepID=UPI002415484B|nr:MULTISPECIES: hypothetical protein [unclassified Mesorhizobium]MDG4854596.1 hypothetical protein [Mesorhizobium sp. WSM4982]MDG4916082.1 hypothetical protein [Mesorhizobium sp. WSM4983]
MWTWLFAALLVAVIGWKFAARFLHRRPVVTADDLAKLRLLPRYPKANEDWAVWRPLLDSDLAQITQGEGDFGENYVLEITKAGERALRSAKA